VDAEWFFGRLVARIRLIERDQEHILRCDIPVVRGVTSLSPSMLRRLNELNSHAYGWMVWWDEHNSTITSTFAGAASRNNWWWTWFALETVPIQATFAESIADELALLSGGSVAASEHPTRGARPSIDGWLIAGRQGSREPVASLGHFVTLLDAILFKEGYTEIREPNDLEIWDNFAGHELDPDGWTTVRTASHWHPEHGWCWQHAKVAGFIEGSDGLVNGSTDQASVDPALLRLAAEMNFETGSEPLSWPIIGGWLSADYIGLAHVSHMNGSAIEQIAIDARTGFGTCMGVSAGQLTVSSYDLDDTTVIAASRDDHNLRVREVLRTLQARSGPVGFSYRIGHNSQPTPSVGTFADSPENWLMPKHILLANFGIFNPAGPTVGSLEVGFRGDQQDLYLVLRHPFSPECVHLATADISLGKDAFTTEILDWFPGHNWSPLDWVGMIDESIAESVTEALAQYAATIDREVLLSMVALMTQVQDPWTRVTVTSEIDQGLAKDSISAWNALVTDPLNSAQYQAFIRSAWEGAKVFGAGETDQAQETSDFFRNSIIDRCLTDFEAARNGQGPPLLPLGVNFET